MLTTATMEADADDITLAEGDAETPAVVMLAEGRVLVSFGTCDVIETSDPAVLRRIAALLSVAADAVDAAPQHAWGHA